MRKISKKQASELIKKGVVKPSDSTVRLRQHREIITEVSDVSKSISAAALSINNNVVRASKLVADSTHRNLMGQKSTPDTIYIKNEETSKVWNFEISRDDSGYIKSVRATEERETL